MLTGKKYLSAGTKGLKVCHFSYMLTPQIRACISENGLKVCHFNMFFILRCGLTCFFNNQVSPHFSDGWGHKPLYFSEGGS